MQGLTKVDLPSDTAQAHLNAVVLHADKEAGGQLRAGRPRIEQRGGRVREPALAEQVVRLHGQVDVRPVDAHGDAHEHVLRPLRHTPIHAQQVGALQGLHSHAR